MHCSGQSPKEKREHVPMPALAGLQSWPAFQDEGGTHSMCIRLPATRERFQEWFLSPPDCRLALPQSSRRRVKKYSHSTLPVFHGSSSFWTVEIISFFNSQPFFLPAVTPTAGRLVLPGPRDPEPTDVGRASGRNRPLQL